ncbi:MAG TPA: MFS transporter [Candidatus Wallbacteria bacterium]|nr:MFS transporter [Candidatus Wallbacteria bacterium]
MDFRSLMIIFAVSVSVFMVNLDVSITNIAMPSLNAYFKVGTGDTAKIVLSYLLSLSGFLLVFGKLSDEFGSKNVFIPGVLVFKIASILCAFSDTLPLLIASRFLQGIGGAMIAATYGAIVMQYLPQNISGKAFGLITAAGGVGFALGAPIGGYIIERLSWQWIFIVNVPICLLTLVVSLYVFKSKNETASDISRPETSAGAASQFDYPGAFYCFVFLSAFIFAVNQGKIDGWLSPRIVASYAVFAVFLPLFILREKNAPRPLLDFSLLFNKSIMGGFIATLVVIMTLDGLCFLFPLFFETVKKMSPAQTGKLLMIFPLLTVVLSPIAGHLSDKRSPAVISRIALFLITVSAAMFCLFNQGTGLLMVNVSLIIFGSGLALFFPSATALVMSHAPCGREGMAMALYSSVSNMGSILGISIFEWLFAVSNPADNSSYILTAADVSKGFNATAVFASIICAIGFIALITSREKLKEEAGKEDPVLVN